MASSEGTQRRSLKVLRHFCCERQKKIGTVQDAFAARLVAGLCYVGEIMVVLVHLNCHDSRILEQLIVWMALYV